MPQRNYIKTKEKVSKPSKRIVLASDLERYKEIVDVPETFREWVDENIARHPELFPSEIGNGYDLHSIHISRKLPDVILRRIKLKKTQEVFSIAPSSVMPYMTGYTDDVE
ncbi:MAG: hypothetical protein PVJ21_22005, partial [Anaerolineales bacterium]